MAILSDSDTGFASIPTHQGEGYLDVLARFHKHLKPRSYLEIGTDTGASLMLANCASISIDPGYRIDREIVGSKPWCMLFQMGSDQFFKEKNSTTLFERTIDMAFLDGMHQFEFLIRDFHNTEKHCANNSIIFAHDCIPTDSHIARRAVHDVKFLEFSDYPTWWAGDLWKFVMVLKEYRPSLKIVAMNAPPTGLIAITNLDPSSDALKINYFEALEKYRSIELTQKLLDQHIGDLNIIDTASLNSFDKISQHFWL